MRDRLKKFRKDDYVEKRFGKDINVSAKEDAPLRKEMTAAETKAVEKAKPGAATQTFKEAFAAARKNPEAMKAGKFTWNGKSYSTALASEKKAAPARRAAPATRASTPAPAPKKEVKPGIPAAAKSVADKAAGYRAAFQRQDGQAGFSKPKAAATSPASTPKPAAKGDVVKRSQDTARVGSRSLGLRPANFAPVSEARRKQIEEAQKRGYAKGGKIDGCAVRGKTKAGRK